MCEYVLKKKPGGRKQGLDEIYLKKRRSEEKRIFQNRFFANETNSHTIFNTQDVSAIMLFLNYFNYCKRTSIKMEKKYQ